jgi:hypothetical protein
MNGKVFALVVVAVGLSATFACAQEVEPAGLPWSISTPWKINYVGDELLVNITGPANADFVIQICNGTNATYIVVSKGDNLGPDGNTTKSFQLSDGLYHNGTYRIELYEDVDGMLFNITYVEITVVRDQDHLDALAFIELKRDVAADHETLIALMNQLSRVALMALIAFIVTFWGSTIHAICVEILVYKVGIDYYNARRFAGSVNRKRRWWHFGRFQGGTLETNGLPSDRMNDALAKDYYDAAVGGLEIGMTEKAAMERAGRISGFYGMPDPPSSAQDPATWVVGVPRGWVETYGFRKHPTYWSAAFGVCFGVLVPYWYPFIAPTVLCFAMAVLTRKGGA